MTITMRRILLLVAAACGLVSFLVISSSLLPREVAEIPSTWFERSAQASNSYSTNFPLTENPISEGGRWLNGGTVGLDWTNFRTTSNKAYGLEVGTNGYDDSTAIL